MVNINRRVWMIGLLIVTLAAIAVIYWGFVDSDEAEEDTALESLEEQYGIWQTQAIENYDVTVQFIARPAPDRFIALIVRDGQIVEESVTCQPEVNNCTIPNSAEFTIESLFATARDELYRQQRSDRWQTNVTYDDQYHFPAKISSFSTDETIMDAATAWQVQSFEPVLVTD